MPAGRLWGSTSSAVSLIIITGCPPYAVVYCRRSCFSGRHRTHLERSAAARHICTLAACFSQSSEDASLQTLLSVTPSSVFVVPVKWLVIFGHVNRSFYLLTFIYLLLLRVILTVFAYLFSGDQCKKLYENMRTRVGKIMKKEKKSGFGRPRTTMRDKEIIDTWNFLCQHIVRGETTASEDVSIIIYLITFS